MSPEVINKHFLGNNPGLREGNINFNIQEHIKVLDEISAIKMFDGDALFSHMSKASESNNWLVVYHLLTVINNSISLDGNSINVRF